MTKSFFRWLKKKMFQAEFENALATIEPEKQTSSLTTDDLTQHTRFGVIKAMNGMAVAVSSYKHNPHGPDWTTELYLVREGEKLSDAFTTILAMKAISK
jgi:hypothetical protein